MLSQYFKRNSSKSEKMIARVLLNNSMTLAVAESCTGGLLSSRLTDVPGSSVYTKVNYVTYSNESKNKILGVSMKKIKEYGAVSREVAHEMAEGLYEKTACDIAICTTGIAGPGGGSDNKPVGLLYVAIKNQLNIDIKEYKLNPNIPRKEMKYEFTECALNQLKDFIQKHYYLISSDKRSL